MPPAQRPDPGPADAGVALVTGGARRIGEAIVRGLHGAGLRIALHHRASGAAASKLAAELNAARAESVALLEADLLDTPALGALVESAAGAWGRLDVLVNNASSFFPTAVGSVGEAEWESLVGTNLKAPFFLAQAAAPWLTRAGGCIVNVTDIYARRPLKGYPVYSAAKAGLEMLTRALAAELGPAVRVNAVAPGAILWPEPPPDPASRERLIARTALKRKGEAADIAGAVLYLVRDARYVTGHTLVVDGGRSLSF